MARQHRLLPPKPFRSYAEYREAQGPTALGWARTLGPDGVVDALLRSGLRGRGGAGFPAGLKWRTLQHHACPTRFVVCNAAEGEPGTFKDRWLLRHNPYACLEGMLIAASTLATREIYIGIKGSFRTEIRRVQEAMDQMGDAGLLDGVEIHLVEGPGEYLFGEEKALLNFLEDGLPMPREAEKPPYEVGLFATPRSPNPALVNNVETYSHVPGIVGHGPRWFREAGSADTPGTVLFTVSGDVAKPGVYELEAGTPLRTILYEVAGGPRNAEIKAVLSGVSNGVILPRHFDSPADFGSLAMIGSGLGSAGFMVVDETRSMARVAQTVARFLYVESCYQCTACKRGLGAASTALDRIFTLDGGSEEDLERVVHGAQSAPQGNRCYLPVQGSILIPSLLRAFPEEFQELAGECRRLPDPWPLPLLQDFDAERGCFLFDEDTLRKQPDWTVPPAPAAAGPSGAKPRLA